MDAILRGGAAATKAVSSAAAAAITGAGTDAQAGSGAGAAAEAGWLSYWTSDAPRDTSAAGSSSMLGFASSSSSSSSSSAVVPFLAGMIVGQTLLIATILTLLWLLVLRNNPRQPSSGSGSASASGSTSASAGSITTDANGKASKSPIRVRVSRQSEQAFFKALHQQTFAKTKATNETCLWLNVVLARIYHDVTSSDAVMDRLLRFLKTSLNSARNPPFLGPISVESLVLGDAIPVIENVVVNTDYNPSGSQPLDLRAVFTIDFQGEIALTCNTSLVLNWPVDGLASTSVTATVRLTSVRAKVQLHLPCPIRSTDMPEAPENMFSFAFVEEPQFSFTTDTAIGQRVHLSSEKLASIITTNVRKALINKCVLPAQIRFQLFSELVEQRRATAEQRARAQPPVML